MWSVAGKLLGSFVVSCFKKYLPCNPVMCTSDAVVISLRLYGPLLMCQYLHLWVDLKEPAEWSMGILAPG